MQGTEGEIEGESRGGSESRAVRVRGEHGSYGESESRTEQGSEGESRAGQAGQ